jgi:DNA-binding response OmpR family regulator
MTTTANCSLSRTSTVVPSGLVTSTSQVAPSSESRSTELARLVPVAASAADVARSASGPRHARTLVVRPRARGRIRAGSECPLNSRTCGIGHCGGRLKRVRILIVDDDEHLARSLKRGLEAEGYATDVARDGMEGLWLAKEGDYDAIVLDVMLPHLNGYRVCDTLRGAGNWAPILMLTAKDGEHDEAEALDTGADDYLSKPFSFVVLTARLRAIMRRGQRERPVVLSAGDLRLDPGSHKTWRGDVEIPLTPRQFSLLEFLMRRCGETVAKCEILAHVWDFAFDGDPNIVEVYVRHLRRKIDEPFGRAAIQTIRLVGYRLDPDGG